jgi:hypothetical protein
VASYEDPVLKTGDLDVKLKRVENHYRRVSGIAKPKSDEKKKKKKNNYGNIKIDNITIDGN